MAVEREVRGGRLGGAAQSAAISQVYRQTLDEMINEELERKAAVNANLSVSSQEIDHAIEVNARKQSLTSQQLIQEAARNGLPETAYRDLLRRQLLEFKLLQMRVAGQIRVTEDDLKSSYRRAVMERRKTLEVRLRWIVIHVPRDVAPAVAAKQRARAETVAEQARQGVDFAELARKYSDDAATASAGGLLASGLPGRLPVAVDRAALGLDVGEISLPLRVGDTLVVIKVVERAPSNLPTYEEAREELQQQVMGERMDLARKRWLDSLRKRAHIEVKF
jgi:peptidyl-prolyl cis-trans isomerase SurA